MLGEREQQFVIALAFARTETAAMDADHGRKGALAVFGLGQIHLQVLIVGIGEFDVAGEGDIFWNDEFRCLER